jgi:hypothetical protein
LLADTTIDPVISPLTWQLNDLTRFHYGREKENKEEVLWKVQKERQALLELPPLRFR